VTHTTNARIAGFTYLFYIAVALPGMILFARATSGDGIAAKLAGIAQHPTDVRISILCTLLTCFAALVLGVTLYRITRDQDPDLAMLALACRVGEGVLSGIFILAMLGLLWLGTTTGANAPNTDAAHALAAFLLKVQGWNPILGASFFAVGSLLFSWLLLRGRMIPLALGWLGVLASALLVIGLPVQLAGFVGGAITQFMWLPMAAFELTLAPWLLIKGAAAPASSSAS
jgi:hypothetical protein